MTSLSFFEFTTAQTIATMPEITRSHIQNTENWLNTIPIKPATNKTIPIVKGALFIFMVF